MSLVSNRFWKAYGTRTLVAGAVVTLIAAAIIGQLAFSTDYEASLPDLAPDAASFTLLDSTPADGRFLYSANDETDNQIAYVSIGEGTGYGGPMVVAVLWTNDGIIQDIEVIENRDTPAWYVKLAQNDYFTQYLGRQYSQPMILGEEIDVTSGASRSSDAVNGGISEGRQILSEYLGDPFPVTKEPISFGIDAFFILAGFASAVFFRYIPIFRRQWWPRYFTLIISLVVFGFVLSIPLSLVNFAIWPVGFYPDFNTNLLFYILIGGVIGGALLLNKNLWCFWLCPYNGIQEATCFIGGNRAHPISKRHLALRNTRYFLLWLVMMAVLLMRNPAISTYEPWGTVFSFTGSLEQWILVIVTLGIAMFIRDFWCHFLCPVGATMDTILGVRRWVTNLIRGTFAR
ncbi:MAG: FMN-binding protein [Chloroflexi bacterium]|nr:FMN-binding protein [Chloroflexota bacterium]